MVMTYHTIVCAKTLLAVLLLTMLYTGFAQAVEINVAVDRNPVSINDSFQLTFSAAESPDDDPDFTPLQRDFEILGQQQSTNASWVNGSFTKAITWTLNVMAKRTGKLQIPAIAFGDDSSKPLSITITQAADVNGGNQDLFLQVEVEPKQVYVQSQLIYTLRLYRRVQITQASLTEPEPDDAVVEKLTEDSNYNTQIDGVSYAVTERKYAILPQQSGVLTIPPLVLNAQVISSGRSRFNGFFGSQITKTKRVTSKAVTVEVLPAPESAKGDYWLPAEQVYVEQKWSNDELEVKVGEPLTRTLSILAKGATVSQLPEFGARQDNPQLKSYPDQPVLKEQKTAEGLIALREEKIAFIPSSPGTYTLPAIEIPWFNTQTGQMETASIPAVTLTAVGAATPVMAPVSSLTGTQETAAGRETTVLETENPVWMWLALFFGTGWLMTLLLMFRRRFTRPEQPEPVDLAQRRLKDLSKALKKACQEHDPQRAKQALLQWGKIHFGANSLGAIAPHCEARLRDEILYLNQCLYAAEKSSWNGKKLFQAFSEHQARKQMNKLHDPALEPLYRV